VRVSLRNQQIGNYFDAGHLMSVHVRFHVSGLTQRFLDIFLGERRSGVDGEASDHRLLVNELAFCSLEQPNMIQLVKQDGNVCALIGPDPEHGIAGYGNTADEALCDLAWAIEAQQFESGNESPSPAYGKRARRLAEMTRRDANNERFALTSSQFMT
jgi:hypothetical protein